MSHHHHLLNTHGSSFNNVASHNLLQIEKLNTFVTNIVPNSKENELDQHILKENIESENKLTKLKVKRFTDVATHRINNTSEKPRKKRTVTNKKVKNRSGKIELKYIENSNQRAVTKNCRSLTLLQKVSI